MDTILVMVGPVEITSVTDNPALDINNQSLHPLIMINLENKNTMTQDYGVIVRAFAKGLYNGIVTDMN